MKGLEMAMENDSKNEFSQRLDFYWQYLTAYFVAMLIYGVAMGSIHAGYLTIRWFDPVIILLLLFMMASAFFLLYNFWKKKSIVVGDDYIIFYARRKERIFHAEDIQKIYIGRKRHISLPNTLRIVKIKVKSRKMFIMFRPSSYWNDKELMRRIHVLKQNLEQNHK